METKTPPSFTVSLRGYDREEVDEYLDGLAEALERLDEAEERNRRLQSQVTRQAARIDELEERIRTETPRTVGALGERLSLLLGEAEAAAEECVAKAEVEAREHLEAAQAEAASITDKARREASALLDEASARAAQADELLRSATSRAQAQAAEIEEQARQRAAEVLADAEGRAAARTRQIEQWAEQVISHTRAEEARMRTEHEQAAAAARAQLAALAGERDAAVAVLERLRDSLDHAVRSAGTRAPEAEPQSPACSGAPEAT